MTDTTNTTDYARGMRDMVIDSTKARLHGLAKRAPGFTNQQLILLDSLLSEFDRRNRAAKREEAE